MGQNNLQVGEVEVYGYFAAVAQPRFAKQECNASRDVICQECQTCGQGFYTNNTCGANYSNNRLDTQCSHCPEDYFCPGTNTFQQPLLCSGQRCGANQQVATLCNATHNITCTACPASTWSPPNQLTRQSCFCNAGYRNNDNVCSMPHRQVFNHGQ